MANYPFRILIETKKGKQFSYIACENQSTASISQSLFRSALFPNNAMSASQVFNRITGSISCSYQNNFEFSSSANQFRVDRTFRQNHFLSSSLNGGPNTGSIKFINKGLYGSGGVRDTLKKFKFFGEKVCTALGVAEDLWYFSDEFRLVSGSDRHYFRGDIVADSLNVVNNMGISNIGRVTSDIPFKIDKESDRYIKFIKQSSSIAPNNDLLIGYNDTLNQYWISASNNSNDPVDFRIGGVDRIDCTELNVSRFTASRQVILEEMVLDDGDKIDDLDSDTHIRYNFSSWNNTYSNTNDDTIAIVNGRTSPTIIFAPNQIYVNPMNQAIDFRMDGDTNDNLFLISASNEKVGIRTPDPTKELQVSGAISASSHLYVGGDGATNTISVRKEDGSTFGGLALYNNGWGNGDLDGFVSLDGSENLLIKTQNGGGDIQITPNTGKGLLIGTDTFKETLTVGGSGSFTGHITASGNISSSGVIKGDSFQSDGYTVAAHVNDVIRFGNSTTETRIYADNLIQLNTNTDVSGHISASTGIHGGTAGSQTTGSYDFPGAIMGYNVQGLNVADDSYSLTTSYAVPDAGMNVTFVAPKSGIVEIEVQVYIDAGSSGTGDLFFGLSDNSTYNAVQTYYEVGVLGPPRYDHNIVVNKWVVSGLTAGTTYQYWLGAKITSTSGTPTLKWGANTNNEYPPFIMKATALPSNAVVET